jgi:oligosaccharyltransferase complex subunit alpha (ribophorin I)
LFGVELPRPLDADGTVNLVLETVETHATYPWPQSAAQDEEQKLKYNTSLFIISPYYTAVQRTKIKSPSPRIISYTTPENVDAFTMENPVTQSGSTITYGPYNNVAPSANSDFIDQHQKMVTVHFNYDYPVLEVTKYKRIAEISHWGANLNIEDEIHLHNAGPTLKGHFSRFQHQTQAFYKRSPPHVLTAMNLHLPAGIHNTYYYDLIGNVSTSHLRSTPSVSRNVRSPQYSVLELKPRYPIMGGWNYSFTLGWDSPLADSGSWDAKNERYTVGVPVMTLMPSTVITDAEVKIILPEGATDVEVFPPFPALASSISTHVTYLDTTGRPAITFEYKQLTDRHNQIIYVAYKVPVSAHLKKPLAVATAFISLFMLALGGRRVNLSLHK